MAQSEIGNLLIAVVVLTFVAGLAFIVEGNFEKFIQVFAFSTVVIFIHVFVQKIAAFSLDANVEHRIWSVLRYGFKPEQHFRKEVPAGIILPLFFSVFTLGFLKFTTILTYEAKALKERAARRFGYYSFTELSDWHNGLIGAAGIAAVLLVSFLGYVFDFEYLAKIAAYYAFFNLMPLSNLDGSQIFFGSKIFWTTLAFIAAVFTAYALFLPI